MLATNSKDDVLCQIANQCLEINFLIYIQRQKKMEINKIRLNTHWFINSSKNWKNSIKLLELYKNAHTYCTCGCKPCRALGFQNYSLRFIFHCVPHYYVEHLTIIKIYEVLSWFKFIPCNQGPNKNLDATEQILKKR